jgi:hypothetical protein
MRKVRGFAWLAVFGALAPPAAGATPQILAHGTADAVGGRLVRTSASGDLMVMWSDGHRVRASFRLNGGPFFAPHAVPGLHPETTNLAGVRPLITTTGNAVVAWPAGDGSTTLVAPAPRGGPFGVPQIAPGRIAFGSSTLAFSPDRHGAMLKGSSRAGVAAALGEPDGH